MFLQSDDGVPPSSQRQENTIPQGGLWPAEITRVGETTLWSHLSRMLKPGWIGRPTHWICHAGGQSSLPSQGWKTQGNLPGKSGLPFQSQQLEARSSWAKGILHPLPPSTSPGMCFSLMSCHIRTCNSSLFS